MKELLVSSGIPKLGGASFIGVKIRCLDSADAYDLPACVVVFRFWAIPAKWTRKESGAGFRGGVRGHELCEVGSFNTLFGGLKRAPALLIAALN
jgi:hypothetical protein